MKRIKIFYLVVMVLFAQVPEIQAMPSQAQKILQLQDKTSIELTQPDIENCPLLKSILEETGIKEKAIVEYIGPEASIKDILKLFKLAQQKLKIAKALHGQLNLSDFSNADLVKLVNIANYLGYHEIIKDLMAEVINRSQTYPIKETKALLKDLVQNIPEDMLFTLILKATCSLSEKSAEVLQGHTAHLDAITILAVLSEDKFISNSDDKTIRVWELVNGKWTSAATLSDHTGYITALTVLSENKFISCADDKTIRVWELINGRWQSAQLKPLNNNYGYTMVLATLSENKFISCSFKKIKVWELVNGFWQSIELNDHTNVVNTLAVLSENKFISGSNDNTIRVWEFVDDSWQPTKLQGHAGYIRALSVLSTNKFISYAGDNAIKVWELVNGTWHPTKLQLPALPNQYGCLKALATLSNNKFISCSCGDVRIRVWTLVEEKLQITPPIYGHTNYVNTLAVLSEDKFISGSCDNTIRVWTNPSKWMRTWADKALLLACYLMHEKQNCSLTIEDCTEIVGELYNDASDDLKQALIEAKWLTKSSGFGCTIS
ncbi:MAG: WD40 repeat domain-containing protein [Candidatus Amoebophilus sp.]